MGYFKDKYTKLEALLEDSKSGKISEGEFKKELWFALKEVAKDQRYKAVEKVQEHLSFNPNSVIDNIIMNSIQNSDLGD